MTEDELIRAYGMDPSRLHRGGAIVGKTRELVVATYGTRCWRCGDEIDTSLSSRHPRGLTIGHVEPVSLGGSDALENLRPEHWRCNYLARAVDDDPPARIAVPIRRV